jgi:thioredoxin-related protein
MKNLLTYLILIIVVAAAGCGSEERLDEIDVTAINNKIEALDKMTDSLETKRVEHERMQRIILVHHDSNSRKDDFYEQIDLKEIKDFRHFLLKNYVHYYSYRFVFQYDYTFHFGIGTNSEYFVNTDWKTDSIDINTKVGFLISSVFFTA